MHDAGLLLAPDPYSVRTRLKPVSFVCIAPGAAHVYLVGNFNGWNPVSHPMQRQPEGVWQIQLPLHHGYHQYLFLVDGKPELDPCAQGVAHNPHGQRASLMAVRER